MKKKILSIISLILSEVVLVGFAKTSEIELNIEKQMNADKMAKETMAISFADIPQKYSWSLSVPMISKTSEAITDDETIFETVSETISEDVYSIPYYSSYKGFKSYMGYNSITRGQQLKLQKISETDNKGFRKCDDRYEIALGTHFNAKIGQYVDIVLENGEIIPCILGDVKADQDTNEDNIMTTYSHCVSEFIIDKSVMDNYVLQMGDVSYAFDEWQYNVTSVKIYDKQVVF